MSKVTSGQALLVLGVLLGLLAGEPIVAAAGWERLSTAPADVQRVALGSCLSMFLAALVTARRVD